MELLQFDCHSSWRLWKACARDRMYEKVGTDWGRDFPDSLSRLWIENKMPGAGQCQLCSVCPGPLIQLWHSVLLCWLDFHDCDKLPETINSKEERFMGLKLHSSSPAVVHEVMAPCVPHSPDSGESVGSLRSHEATHQQKVVISSSSEAYCNSKNFSRTLCSPYFENNHRCLDPKINKSML
jgi:hypothetical protein